MLNGVKVTDLDLALVKEYLKVDFEDDDVLITTMLYGARSFIQSYLNRKFTDWTTDELPDEFTIAALAIIAHWYDTRAVTPDKSLTKDELPYVFAGLLDLHRNWNAEDYVEDVTTIV